MRCCVSCSCTARACLCTCRQCSTSNSPPAPAPLPTDIDSVKGWRFQRGEWQRDREIERGNGPKWSCQSASQNAAGRQFPVASDAGSILLPPLLPPSFTLHPLPCLPSLPREGKQEVEPIVKPARLRAVTCVQLPSSFVVFHGFRLLLRLRIFYPNWRRQK